MADLSSLRKSLPEQLNSLLAVAAHGASPEVRRILQSFKAVSAQIEDANGPLGEERPPEENLELATKVVITLERQEAPESAETNGVNAVRPWPRFKPIKLEGKPLSQYVDEGR
jgi:hypothetical protein